MNFRDRSCGNKLLYLVFRLLKLIYNCTWFYFMPWLSSYFVVFVLLY